MMNIYFPDEEITDNDLYFICYMIERVARKLHQKNKYVVNTIGRDALKHLISVANVLHCENPLQVEDDWIEEYHLQEGDYDITDVANLLRLHKRRGITTTVPLWRHQRAAEYQSG